MTMQEINPITPPVSGVPAPADITLRPVEPPRQRHAMGEKAATAAAGLSGRAIAPSLVTGLSLAFEFLWLVAVSCIMAVIWAGGSAFGDLSYLGPALGGPILAVLAIQATGGYDLSRLRRHQIRLGRALVAWSVVFGVFAVTIIVGDLAPTVARSWYPAWYLAGVGTFIFTTSFIAYVVRRLTLAGRLQRRAAIVGGGPNAESLIDALNRTGGNEIQIVGIFDDRDDQRSPESQAGYPKLGNTADLVDFARVASVDLLIVSIPMIAETRLLQLLKQLWVLPVDIRLAAHTSKLRLRPRSYSYVGEVPFLDLFDRPIAGWDSVAKRIFDVVFASLAIVALSPVMLATAIAVKLDSRGPVLFRQKRYGFNNEVIEVMKFRSMFTDMADPAAKKAVTRDDPRVTRVGRFIRRTSLDELPQFFNVLKGDLSLVGPRPHAVNAHTKERLWEEVVDGYFARHKVKPGVTGWAQINGWRGEVDDPHKIQARVAHDLHYIENWSVLFDLYILLLTPVRILNQENAY